MEAAGEWVEEEVLANDVGVVGGVFAVQLVDELEVGVDAWVGCCWGRVEGWVIAI